MEQQQSSFKEKERTDLREPQHFKVIIYNDDFTTMEFVVKILTTIFFKSTAEAETLMLQVHKSQSAVVGIYVGGRWPTAGAPGSGGGRPRIG